MRLAYCDCFSGVSGDMFLGALVDAGLPLEHLRQQIGLLQMHEQVQINTETVHKGALRACSVEVIAPESHHHRHPEDIRNMIVESTLSDAVKQNSLAIFQVLAEAEGRVHGIDVEEVHFHEVGALDSIVDIVGAAIGVEALGIERLYASALPYGSGQVDSQHGLLPLPAPATLEILTRAHAPLIPFDTQSELVTPTGAAILATLATFERPNLTLAGLGVGAGKRDLNWPNVMRLIIGESAQEANQPMVLIESNIDDMNPQLFGSLMGRLFAAGALDVFLTPIYMKKNRPATMLGVIARRAEELALAKIILAETTTFGMRVQPVYRYEAEREIRSVETQYGKISVKVKLIDGRRIQAQPEYDACLTAANQQNIPVGEVYTAVLLAARSLLEN